MESKVDYKPPKKGRVSTTKTALLRLRIATETNMATLVAKLSSSSRPIRTQATRTVSETSTKGLATLRTIKLTIEI